MAEIIIKGYQMKLKGDYIVLTPILETYEPIHLVTLTAFRIANTYKIHEKLWNCLWIDFTKDIFFRLESFEKELLNLKKEIEYLKKKGSNFLNINENLN